MPIIEESATISGVYTARLKAFGDDRGRFMEMFRKEWFPQRSWDIVQANRSESAANVLRGLHYHHKQVDFWHLIQGTIRAGLYDLRPNSPTYGQGQLIELDGSDYQGLFIPIGVAHGFLSLTAATLLYIVDNYYDGDDELGVAWNDPDIAMDWGVDAPVLSGRDRQNPRLRDIPAEKLPR